jgi:hypothetical protein
MTDEARPRDAKAAEYFREQSKRLGDGPDGGKARGKKTGKAKKAAPGDGASAPETCAQDDVAPETFAPETFAPEGPGAAEILAKLIQGDADAFVARCAKDVGFPFEPEAIGALGEFKTANPAAYERLRARLKAETEVRLPEIEELMRRARPSGMIGGGADDGLPGRPVSYDAIEPWDEPVDGAALLDELAPAIRAYVVMDPRQRDAVALWAVFTHAHNLRNYAPLLVITSPMRRCGKTKLQETLAHLVPKPEPTSGVSAAMLPRLIERHRPTLLIDEFDAMMKGDKDMAEMLRGLINSSFNRAGAGVLKLVPVPGGDWQERRFSLWAPASVGGIGKPPDTVEDRAVNIRIVRKLAGEKVSRLRGKDGGELDALRRKIVRWAADHEQALRTIEPEALAGLNDRQADAWEPLFAIADVAGGDWPRRARDAARALCGVDEAEAQEDDVRLMLLADVRDGFAKSHVSIPRQSRGL